MARPREFDTDAALSGAMDVFWEHGYEGASLPDLLTGMNLTRGSLYRAFKDKKSLFLTVLTRYEDSAVDAAALLLSDDNIPDGWDRVTHLLKRSRKRWDLVITGAVYSVQQPLDPHLMTSKSPPRCTNP